MKTMSITWWGLLPGLPQPSSENGSLNSTKDANGQGQVPGPKRLCALSHVQSTLVRASDDSSSIAGCLQGHPGCPKWGQIQHFLFTLSSLFSPHLIIGTRPWPAAIPMPMKGWPHYTRFRIQNSTHCQHLQVLGLGSSTRTFPLPSCWACPGWAYSSV